MPSWRDQSKPARDPESAVCRCVGTGHSSPANHSASPLGIVRHGSGKRETPRIRAEESQDALASRQARTGLASVVPVQLQLTRMLQSRIFVQSGKLSRFLRFIVEHAIDGDPSCLKEYVIGSEVYDRKPPYHPSQDSIVRTEARRLRNKLREYYESEGKDDPVYIYMRPGNYIPVFQLREDLLGESSSIPSHASLPPENRAPITVAVLPFRDIPGSPLSLAYAGAITEELAYALMQDPVCSVVSPFSIARCLDQSHDMPCTLTRIGAQIFYEGSVRFEGVRLRVTARILDAAGVQLWLRRIDMEIDIDRPFAAEEQIGTELAAGFHSLFGQSQRGSRLSMTMPIAIKR